MVGKFCSLTQAQAIRNKTSVNSRLRNYKNIYIYISRLRDFNTLTEMTKMQENKKEQLDNKSFKYILV